MSYAFTTTESTTFTVTHARHMAAKVAADLKRMQRFYGYPSDTHIAIYEAEVTELLKRGYLGTVTYGFKLSGNWIEPTLRYTAHDLGFGAATDDDPGRVTPNANITGATFHSYLTYNSAWSSASQAERDSYRQNTPLRREDGVEPGISGYLSDDRIYSAGGRALNRSCVKSYK